MNSAFQPRTVYLGVLPGAVIGGLTLLVEKFASISANPMVGIIQRAVMILILPGLIGSTIISNNVHAFSLTVAAILNAIIYSAIGVLSSLFLTKMGRTKTLIVFGMLLVIRNSAAQNSQVDKFQVARQSYASGRYADAEKAFAEITREHPDNIAAQMYLGQTLFKEEKFAAAIIPYEKVLSLEKSGTKLTLTQHRILSDQLAMAYGVSGRSADAKALLQESVRTDPGYPLNYYNLACVSADEDDKAGVLKNLSLAFQHKDQMLPGEHMPDPASDPSFKKFAQDADFKTLLTRLGR